MHKTSSLNTLSVYYNSVINIYKRIKLSNGSSMTQKNICQVDGESRRLSSNLVVRDLRYLYSKVHIA